MIRITNTEFEELVKIRRYFHEHPEKGPKEQINTMNYIMRYLDALKIKYEYIKNGGIIAFIENLKKNKKTLLLRADMDALPIKEDLFNYKIKKRVFLKLME